MKLCKIKRFCKLLNLGLLYLVTMETFQDKKWWSTFELEDTLNNQTVE